MKTYSNKSNAKRAAINFIASELGLDKEYVKANEANYFEIVKAEEGFLIEYVKFAKEEAQAVVEFAENDAPTIEPQVVSVNHEMRSHFKELEGLPKECPHCGIDYIDNGFSIHNEPTAHETHQVACLGCGEEFGKAIGKGIKIEKNREEKNGIIRPSIGGKCREVWDACDAYLDNNGVLLTPKGMKLLAEENGWNVNNSIIEMYQWRKFNGIVGRQKVAKKED